MNERIRYMDRLSEYKVTYIKIGYSLRIFSKPQTVIDEGDYYRIADLYLIIKSKIDSIDIKNETITVRYRDGVVVEMGVF